MWDNMYEDIKFGIDTYSPKDSEEKEETLVQNNVAIEEILQIVRKQNVLLNTPEQLLPLEYLSVAMGRADLNQNGDELMDTIIGNTVVFIDNLYEANDKGLLDEKSKQLFMEINIIGFIGLFVETVLKSNTLSVRSRHHITKLEDRARGLVKMLRTSEE